MTAYEEGILANQEGKSFDDCPYEDSYCNFDYDDWQRGWCDAEKRRKEEGNQE